MHLKRSESGPWAVDFYLGDWLVEPGLCRLSLGGRHVHLRSKVMDVLVYLAGYAGSVVAKEKVIDAVWARKFIADTALSRAVFELREALGDHCRAPRYVETVAKRGYRLLAPVSVVEPPIGGAPGQCVIVVDRQRISLRQGETLIGRASEADIRVDSGDVSPYHARLCVSGRTAVLEDLGRKNWTYLREQRIDAPVELHDGDLVRVGPAVLVFRVVSPESPTETGTPRS